MAWPTTPASTVNVDQGTDNPGNARADIKQNIDNVNAIISEFGDVAVSGATDAQYMKYNSANSRWEPASISGAAAQQKAYFVANGAVTDPDNSSPNHHYGLGYTVDVDENSMLTIETDYGYLNLENDTTSESYIALAAGTYVLQMTGITLGTAIGTHRLESWIRSSKTLGTISSSFNTQLLSTQLDSMDPDTTLTDEKFMAIHKTVRFSIGSGVDGIKITHQPQQAGHITTSLQCEITKE